jgi:hypothetical protein
VSEQPVLAASRLSVTGNPDDAVARGVYPAAPTSTGDGLVEVKAIV